MWVGVKDSILELTSYPGSYFPKSWILPYLKSPLLPTPDDGEVQGWRGKEGFSMEGVVGSYKRDGLEVWSPWLLSPTPPQQPPDKQFPY